jgi:hypothetical protein
MLFAGDYPGERWEEMGRFTTTSYRRLARRALTWFDSQPRTVTAEEVDAAALAVLVSEQEDDEMRQAAPRAWSLPGFAGEREHYRETIIAALPALRLVEAPDGFCACHADRMGRTGDCGIAAHRAASGAEGR